MRRSRPWLFGAALISLLTLATQSYWSSSLIGYWRGEASYHGRYTNYWKGVLSSFQVEQLGWNFEGALTPQAAPEKLLAIRRAESLWDKWLSCVGLPQRTAVPSLLDGGPEAIEVLIDLLNVQDENVQRLANLGLRRSGKYARPAVPLLLNRIEVAKPAMQWEIYNTLEWIDPASLECAEQRGIRARDLWYLALSGK